MRTDIRMKLIEIARLRTTWTYSQLNEQMLLGLDFSIENHRQLIGDWLGEISEYEFSKGRPLLSSLITHKNGKREQGDGFYKLCSHLFGKDWISLKKDKKWENSLIADCYTFWLDSTKYSKFINDC